MVIGGICLATAVIAVLAMMVYLDKTLKRLEHMLEDAMAGKYVEKTYDESRMSRLESKLAKFLTMSQLAKSRVQEEKDLMAQTVSDISHQTKTPITNIMMYTQLLQEMNLGDEEREVATRIATQTERLNFITQSLVKVSRLEHGMIQMKPTRQSLVELAYECVDSSQKKMEEKKITWEIVSASEDVEAVFDKKWTREAILNILDNAMKYTGEGGNVQIKIKEYEMYHVMEICDDGMGIGEEEQGKVFQRFYRGKDVSQQEGVGIGLYLARKIISMEGGYIRLHSRKGEGSAFGVYLPAHL